MYCLLLQIYPQRLMTGFVLQGHMWELSNCVFEFDCVFVGGGLGGRELCCVHRLVQTPWTGHCFTLQVQYEDNINITDISLHQCQNSNLIPMHLDYFHYCNLLLSEH